MHRKLLFVVKSVHNLIHFYQFCSVNLLDVGYNHKSVLKLEMVVINCSR